MILRGLLLSAMCSVIWCVTLYAQTPSTSIVVTFTADASVREPLQIRLGEQMQTLPAFQPLPILKSTSSFRQLEFNTDYLLEIKGTQSSISSKTYTFKIPSITPQIGLSVSVNPSLPANQRIVVRTESGCLVPTKDTKPIVFLTPEKINVRGGLKIRSAGLYVLTENVPFGQPNAAAITIASDDVTIDLNGKTLKSVSGSGRNMGINIATLRPSPNNLNDFYNITIKNGTISDFNRFGIMINGGARYITLEDLSIINSPFSFDQQEPTGIFFNGNASALINDIEIKNCRIDLGRYGIFASFTNNVDLVNYISNNSFASGVALNQCSLWDIKNSTFSNQLGANASTGSFGLLAQGCSSVTVRDSDFSFNTGKVSGASLAGLSFVGLTNAPSGSHIIDNCTFSKNSAIAAIVRGLELVDTHSCVIRDCIANGNFSSTALAAGFYVVSGSSGNLFERCIADGNYTFGAATASGFYMEGNGNCLVECTAKGNLSASGIGNGIFVTSLATESLVRDSIAVGNSTNGFVNDSASSFVGNFATGNGTANYTGAGTIGFLTVINGAQPTGGSFDERRIDNIQIV